ncbi:transmembrane protein 243-like isoform X1 [Mizuhopecten yessoensis]|uniref:Transmembrane protein 243 n=1 Tax=Mizuhopecten yessoensis TaxID=6573 RepID=A0A210R0N5_MIZYE|nr:transmembrane protein 243-like isoform X1 [Mizuhopecten yessoensis]OWF54586.1 Transmembrane protein 243 [Mizuhopecten yessoensis]
MAGRAEQAFTADFTNTLRRPGGGRRLDLPAQRCMTCDRVLNVIVAVFTIIIVIETLVSAFLLPRWPPEGNNIFFAVTIVCQCASHLLQIYWYRQGEMEPKFRRIILYNAVTISLLCVCGNLYIHGVGVGNTCNKARKT